MQKKAETTAAAIWLHVNDLTPWKFNPRKNDHAVERVAKNIEALGFGSPIVARPMPDGTREIIAGHTRLKAMKRLLAERGESFTALGTPGPGLVPVRILEHLTDDQAAALAIADNKLSEMSAWDDGMLVDLMRALDEDQQTNTGFSTNEIERLFAESKSVDTDGEYISEPDQLLEKWRVRPGDVWKADQQIVACGDSRDSKLWEKLFGDERAMWMWTDPPYGVNYKGKTKHALTIQNDVGDLSSLLRDSFAVVDRFMADGCVIYMSTAAGVSALEFGNAFISAGWQLKQNLVWLKDSMVPGYSDYHYQHEPILYGCKSPSGRWGRGAPQGWYGDNAQTSVLEHARPKRSTQHPTMKPVSLVEQCLTNSSRRGDLGIEPFAGSGTTLVASHNLGRRCIATEIDPKYVAVCLERLESVGAQPKRM